MFFFSFQINTYSLQTEEKPQLTKRQNTAIQNSSLKATFKTLSKSPFSYFPRDQPHKHFISSLGAQYLFCKHFFHVTEYSRCQDC